MGRQTKLLVIIIGRFSLGKLKKNLGKCRLNTFPLKGTIYVIKIICIMYLISFVFVISSNFGVITRNEISIENPRDSSVNGPWSATVFFPQRPGLYLEFIAGPNILASLVAGQVR